jgi:hypothetical protein
VISEISKFCYRDNGCRYISQHQAQFIYIYIYIYISETHWYSVANNDFAAIYLWLPGTMWPLRQTLVLILATKVAVNGSVLQPATIFTYVLKSTNVYEWNMFHHVINYQHVSISFGIIGVDLQEYKEYNNLWHGLSGTTKSYNKCIKHWVFQTFFITLLMLPWRWWQKWSIHVDN